MHRREEFYSEWNEMNSPSTRAHIFIVTYTKIDGFVDSRQEREREKHNRHELTMVKNKWKKNKISFEQCTMHNAQYTLRRLFM